ncbi:pentapeptide repeat-containing protein [Neobacillus rhizosphaerae]|uniref:pentapeptide repeat-containing protein n=1 Tax=Neobacillus rhizosphaerae TaxID=2880965 RepID=UPI003D286681
MSEQQRGNQNHLRADCESCFGLCCVALPYAKSADFAFDKEGGTPCKNLQSDYRCRIHSHLRDKGFKGCTVYECFGAGQKVSQFTYIGKDWRENPELAEEMFDVFPVMQQLHEMLLYLNEAIGNEKARPIYDELLQAIEDTEQLTHLSPNELLNLDIPNHRAVVNNLLLQTSEFVRAKVKKDKNRSSKVKKGIGLIGANLSGNDLRGSNFRGALLIAANLRNSDLRMSDFIGADLRDADLSGANLHGSIFLTQAQVNAAKGDRDTNLPASLHVPSHWLV